MSLEPDDWDWECVTDSEDEFDKDKEDADSLSDYESDSDDEEGTGSNRSVPIYGNGQPIEPITADLIRQTLQDLTMNKVLINTRDIERFAVPLEHDSSLDIYALMREAFSLYVRVIDQDNKFTLSTLALVYYWRVVWSELICGELDIPDICRGKKVLVSACQGGKTMALIMDGLLRAIGRGDEVMFFGISTADMYSHMQSSFQDVMDRFQTILDQLPPHLKMSSSDICECVRLNNPPVSEDENVGVFRMRVGAVGNVRSLYKHDVPDDGAGFHFIVDESHLTEGDALYHSAIREWFAKAVSGTYVTATPSANIAMGGNYSVMLIKPRGGFYLDHHQYSTHADIFRMETSAVYPTTMTDRAKAELSALNPPLGAFAKGKHRDIMGVEPRWWTHLATKEERSCLHLVINNVLARANRGNSINAGHVEMARWMAKTHIGHNKADKKNATVVSFAIYRSTTTLSSDYATPRIFFDRGFRSKLKKRSTRNAIDSAVDSLFTTDPSKANVKIQLPNRMVKAGGMEKLKADLKDHYKNDIKTEDAQDSCFSMALPFPFTPKAVLSFIHTVYKASADEVDTRTYHSHPLQIFAVGEGLIRQSVNIESKDREIQTTKLTYIAKASSKAQIGVAELTQQVCRINGGHRDKSKWARSRLPATFDWAKWKQTPEAIKQVSPRFYADTAIINIVSDNSRHIHVMRGPKDIERLGILTAADTHHHISKLKRVRSNTDEQLHNGGKRTLAKRQKYKQNREDIQSFIRDFGAFTSQTATTSEQRMWVTKILFRHIGMDLEASKAYIKTHTVPVLVAKTNRVDSGKHITCSIKSLKRFIASGK